MDLFKPAKKPLTTDKIVISIRLNVDRLENIDKLASKINISRNELINQCVEYALSNLDFKKYESKKEKD